MRTLCFYFQVHQPFRLKDPYRFFDIGSDHYYYDDYSNHAIMRKVAEKCYLPTNQAMLDLIMEYGKKFKISYSLSGTVLDQFEKYAPDVLESFKQLVNTGSVEILSETYSHSLSALKSKQEFIEQVKAHDDKVFQLFGVKPTTFRNTELIYSDFIGEMVAEMGYKAMLTEGAKHILGWKSPNFLYYNAYNPKLKVLLKNFKLSDDVAFRFSNREWDEYPLTTEKYVTWLNSTQGDTINLFMDYETFGEHQWADTGIFQFLRALPNAIFRYAPDLQFATPSEGRNSSICRRNKCSLSNLLGRRRTRPYRMARKRTPRRSFRETLRPRTDGSRNRRRTNPTRLEISPNKRPLLLYVYQILLRRKRTQIFQPLQQPL